MIAPHRRRQCIFIASLSLISISNAFIRPKPKQEEPEFGSKFMFRMSKPQQLTFDEMPVKQGELDLTSLDSHFNELPDIEAQFFSDEPLMKFNKKNSTLGGWFGEDDEHGNAINLINHKGKFHGSVNFNDRIYTITTRPNGSTEVSEINVRDLPPEDPETGGGRRRLLPKNGRRLRGPNPPDGRRPEERDSGDVIDIMCIYTMNAMCAEAGYGNTNRCDNSDENRESMDSKCQLAVEETNFAYTESEIETRLNLVHTGPVNYEDMSYYGHDNLLERMTEGDDGIMDDVHVWREQYHADLVVLITENRNACGLAWTFNGDPSSGFSVVYRKCMTGYYSFGHEIGHNFGCTHDRATRGHTDVRAFSKSGYGYRDPKSRFRDIMAYDCPGGCTKVQRFSNNKSTIAINGKQVPVGSQHDNCAQQINNVRTQVANYMNSVQVIDPIVEHIPEPHVPETNFLGCYNDVEDDRALEIFVGNNMNFDTCRKACVNLGTPVFGQQAMGECWCGSGRYRKYGRAEDCDCAAGNVGDWKFCAYQIDDFEGCYKDTAVRALKYFAGDDLPPNECRKECKEKGFHFMGRQGNNECWCGGSSPSDTSFAVHGPAGGCDCEPNGTLEPWKNCVHRVFLATFKGCWNDAEPRAFSLFAGKHKSHDECLAVCKMRGFHYMGRQGWGECWCGGVSPVDLSYQNHGIASGCACTGDFLGPWKLCVEQIHHRE